MRGLCLTFLLLVTTIAYSQVLNFPEDFKNTLDTIDYHDQLPNDLLQKKSAVIHFTSKDNWKSKAAVIQKGMNKAGIDAVAHFHINDIFSGKESKEAYLKQLAEREIDYIIFYDEQIQHELVIFPFTESLVPESAYKLKNETLKDLLHRLFLTTARSDQEKTNLLILDVPAYMNLPKVIKGRRAEFYDLNMKSGKLAIPKTTDSLFNQEFDSLMAAHYPFDYGLVEAGMNEEELRKEGYWFIMYGIKGTGKLVRNLLEYATTEEETAYASIVADNGESKVKTFPVEETVVKFYIKDIRNQDFFLGKHYDADITWQAALKNYIMNLRNILVR